MKKLSLCFLLLSLAQGSRAQDYWETVVSGTGKHLLDISFGTPLTGYIAGSDSTLLKTTDAGMTWTPLGTRGISFSATAHDIVDVQFLNDKTGFVVVSNRENPLFQGAVFKTTDGGANWTDETRIGAYRIYYRNEDEGFHIGSGAFSGQHIARLAGGSWMGTQQLSSSPDDFLYAIDFLNRDTGIVAGDKGFVYRTFDGGAHWDTVQTNIDTTINALRYLNKNTIIAATRHTGAAMIISKDGGQSWEFEGSSLTFHYPDMRGLTLSPYDSVIAVGRSSTTEEGMIYRTHKGDTWMSIDNAAHPLNNVTMQNDSVAFIVGDNGLILSNRKSVLSIPGNNKHPEELKAYPSPSTGSISVSFPADHSLRIYDAAGRTVYTAPDWAQQRTLDLSALPKGLYLLEAISREQEKRLRTISLQ